MSVAVAAICVASAIVISGGEGDDDSLAPLTTKQALADVAKATLELPEPRPRQFVYSRMKYTFGAGAGGGRDLDGKRIGDSRSLVDGESESWSSRRLCGLTISRVLARRFPTDRDRENAERMDAVARHYYEESARKRAARGQKPLDSPLDWNQPGSEIVMQLPPAGKPKVLIGGERLTARQLRRYTTDPEAIYRRVHRATSGRRSGYAGGGALGEWGAIMAALSITSVDLPPALRAGFVNALAYVPGVRSLGRETDPEGRAGIGFELVSRGVRNHVIFEAKSGVQVYDEQQIVSRSGLKHSLGWPIGSVTHRQLLLERSIADAPPKGKKIDMKLGGFVRCPK
ncbi:MAG: hypothetical protein HZB14_00995 [Actinobacteria bacterium]|nr:hypothetical protein [Actinomycetota bacterium]